MQKYRKFTVANYQNMLQDHIWHTELAIPNFRDIFYITETWNWNKTDRALGSNSAPFKNLSTIYIYETYTVGMWQSQPKYASVRCGFHVQNLSDVDLLCNQN